MFTRSYPSIPLTIVLNRDSCELTRAKSTSNPPNFLLPMSTPILLLKLRQQRLLLLLLLKLVHHLVCAVAEVVIFGKDRLICAVDRCREFRGYHPL